MIDEIGKFRTVVGLKLKFTDKSKFSEVTPVFIPIGRFFLLDLFLL